MKHRGAAVALAVLLGGLPLTGTASAAAPGTFDLSTLAVGVNISSTQTPPASVVTAGLVDATEAFATSQLSSYGTDESTAATFYPGDLVAGGPQLLCANFVPCPVDPPVYPLVADAAYPTSQAASAPGASARATPRDTAADASWLSQDAGPVTVQAAAATTHAWVDAAGAHVRSRSVVKGITIGPVQIAVLEAVDDVDVPAVGKPVDHPRVTVAGVTVAGQAATLDDTGLHVAGQGVGATIPALAQQGLSVQLLGASHQDAVGSVRSAAGGLVVSVTVPVSGVPQLVPGLPGLNRKYVGSVIVGGAGAVVSAGVDTGLDLVVPSLAVPGSPAAVLTPPYSAPPPPAAVVLPPAKGSGAVPPQFAQPTLRLRGVALYPFASMRGVALLILLAPVLLFGLWRGYVARAWRP